MFTLAPAISEKHHNQDLPESHEFYSVEFGIDESQPVYQFKLWHSDRLPNFFLLKESSALAAHLKAGDIILMKYYCNSPKPSIEHHETRIDAIVNETTGRFKGHFRIKVTILDTDMAIPWQPTGTDN
ncbi:MAG: hypothetical protein PVI60_07305 [Desulfobacteraceae bacterium]|jgi:hypothetical protein